MNRQLVFEDEPGKPAAQFIENAFEQAAINYPRFYKMDLLSKLGWLTTEFLLSADESIKPRLSQLAPESICLLMMNASSSLDTDAKYYKSVAQMASPSLFVYTLPNIVMGEICIRHGFKGENLFFIRDEFNADQLALHVQLMMNQPGNDACICGWVEWLGESYKSALFLLEKIPTAQSVNFTTENINTIYPK